MTFNLLQLPAFYQFEVHAFLCLMLAAAFILWTLPYALLAHAEFIESHTEAGDASVKYFPIVTLKLNF